MYFHCPRALEWLLLASMTLAPLAHAAGAAGNIEVSTPWARATPPMASIGAVYLEIKAISTSDKLLGATTMAAERVEMHASMDNNSIVQMRPLSGIPITPEKPASLTPGGAHLMLIGLRTPLVAGTSIPLTLRFASAGDILVQVAVRKDAP